MKIGIIGAGIAGLTAANMLRDQADVVVCDKSRGIGGRMSTRYAGAFEFDHGAQYFTISDPDFHRLIDRISERGAAKPWRSRGLYLREGTLEADTGRPRWVGAPRMNQLPKALAEDLDIRTAQRVTKIAGERGAYHLLFEGGESAGPFDYVICTTPAPQAAALLSPKSALQATLGAVKMHACFALMVGFPKTGSTFAPRWDTLRVSNLPVSWIALNNAKPERDEDHFALVIHGSPEWSDKNTQADRSTLQDILLDCASALCGVDLSKAPHIALHRWLYAYADHGVGSDTLLDPQSGVILAGDWCVGGRVEGAFVSGRAAAQMVLAEFK